ncbi:MAG TPA: DegT/DnrJ/EryC1/StrS family aminotransferase, partial [Micromonosporaceae bacterium]|nr:DegT/DnrJ/EryC1/StrS family aminotransferase [Micromonosporaceae bacterium]
TCGDGGLVVTSDERTHRRATLLRWLGIDRAADRVTGAYDVAEWGHNFHLNEIGAAIGAANIDLADDVVRRHRANAAVLDDELAGIPGLELTERLPDCEPSCWMFPVKVDDRPAFTRRMADAGIAASVIVRRNDAHSCVRGAAAPLPGMDALEHRMVHLPVGWWLSEEDLAHISKTVRSGW